MDELDALRSDLVAEQGVLDAIVAGLADEEWALPTPSPGWNVADQIGHLAYFDGTAATAITDPGRERLGVDDGGRRRAVEVGEVADLVGDVPARTRRGQRPLLVS